MIYSFDVFDTLITRKTLTPKGVFLFMQEWLKKVPNYNFMADSFALLRVDAELNAVRFNKEREIGLDDIYDVLAKRCHLNDSQKQELINMEIESEKRNVVPIQKNIDILKSIIAEGHKVVLISDMYLTHNVIRELLCLVDDVFKDINIYVSCDCNARKLDGSLFRYVQMKEQAGFDNWIHYGDNVVADNNVPEVYGIKTVLVDGYKPLQIEKKINAHFCNELDYATQFFLGLIRGVYKEGSSNAYRIGSVCGGAVLFPYVEWVLNESVYRNINTLLFMSRDGYILKKIADIIIKKKQYNINTHYVYVSRNLLRAKGEKGKRTAQYISQFVDKDDKYALVDFDGTGQSLVSLSENLKSKIYGFYYYLEGKPSGETFEFYSYSFVPAKSAVCEVLCRAPHGTVLDYKVDDKKLVPVIDSSCGDLWEKSGLYEYIDGVMNFTDTYLKWLDEDFVFADLLKIGKYVLHYCENEYDEEIMKYIGDFPHSDNNEEESGCYAPILSKNELDDIYGKRGDEPLENYYHGANIEYSVKRTLYGKSSFFDFVIKSVKDMEQDDKLLREKVVIYAAGKYGCEAYYRLSKNKDVRVVAWVDSNYQRYNDERIESPVVLKEKDFDFVLVALSDSNTFCSVKRMLEDMGIESKKIIWIIDYWKGFVV